MKRSLGKWGAVLLVTAATVTTSVAQERPLAQDKTSKAQGSWTKHESKDGAFEVLFPGAVTVSTHKLTSGEPFVVAQAKSPDGPAVFVASFNNYAAKSAERYLEGARQAMAARGQLDNSVLLKVAGKPAGDYTYHVKKDGGIEYFRKLMIVDDNRVHQLVVGSTKEKPTEAEVKKFFESFRLVK